MRRRAASLALGLLLAAAPAGAGPTYRVAASWTEAGAAGPLREPMGIAVALDGRVFVADSRDGRVVELSADGGFVRRFTGLKKPVDVAVVPDGTVYVADFDADQVKAFGPRGKLLRAWGGPGKAAGRFHSPAGVAVDAAGDVYVSDFYNDRVQVFDSSGTWLRSIGRKGRGKGELDYPTGLAFDREGHLIVADSYNHRLQTFTPDGKALGRIGSRWRSFLGLTGSLRVPTGVAVDRAGRIAVADSGHGRVVLLGRDGSYRGEWRLPGGVRAGVYSPERVAWASDGDLLAVDTAGDRVLLLRPGGGPAPAPAAAAEASAPASGSVVVRIAGMSCPFCAYGVEKHLKAIPGVASARVNLGQGTAILELTPGGRVSREEIRRAVEDAGFKASQVEGVSGAGGKR